MRIVGFAEIIIDGAPLPPTLFEQWQRKSSGPTHAAGDAKLTIMCPSARRVVHRRTRSFAAVKGLSRHILARRAGGGREDGALPHTPASPENSRTQWGRMW